jgi:steroid delta-isomerase-like uncharacterized protein
VAEDPKVVVRRFMDEVWNGQNPAAVTEIMAEEFRWHHPALGSRQGRDAALEAIQEIRRAFPDYTLTVKEMIAEGDKVATYWSATGTRRAAYRGLPPSEQQATWEGVVLSRVASGRIVEHHAFIHPIGGSPLETVPR